MHILKRLIFLFVLILPPAAAHAADPILDHPHWSLEFKGGRFIPALPDWRRYYEERDAGHYAATLGYKIFRQLEVGIEGGYIRDNGKLNAPLHGTLEGLVTYKLFPLSVFVLVRGVISEDQWLIPYVGGGWTRIYYSEAIQDQGAARGAENGTHTRAGLQFLLDGVDPSAATSMYLDYGVYHTYFFIEAERTRVVIDTVDAVSVNLGGTSYLAGLLFEF